MCISAPVGATLPDNLGWRFDRAFEIADRIGKHFYSKALLGEGFTLIDIVDAEYVKVRLDHGSDNRPARILVGKPSEEWQTTKLSMSLTEIEKQCAAGKLRIGMTRAEAFREWCRPWTVNTEETMGGAREQWVYRDNVGTSLLTRGYLYFENGHLVAIQRN